MTTLALTRTVSTRTISDFGLFRMIRNIGRILGKIAASQRATNDFERMNAKTDAQLAANGLHRTDLGRVVFERHIA